MSKFDVRHIDGDEDIRRYLRYLVDELTHVLSAIDEENITEAFENAIKHKEDE